MIPELMDARRTVALWYTGMMMRHHVIEKTDAGALWVKECEHEWCRWDVPELGLVTYWVYCPATRHFFYIDERLYDEDGDDGVGGGEAWGEGGAAEV